MEDRTLWRRFNTQSKLAEKLDAKEDEVYQKLLEKMQFYSAEKRIVYDKDDKDKPKDGDDDNKKDETPSVVYKVPKYTSVLSGEVDEHDTKYHVTYLGRRGRSVRHPTGKRNRVPDQRRRKDQAKQDRVRTGRLDIPL